MSKIDELIAELCPEGVASIPLAAVAKFARGQTITKHTSEYGPFPVIGGGQKPAYWHNVSNRDCCAITVSGSGAYSGFVSRWDVPIWVSDGFSVDPIEDLADGNYIFHFLKARQAELFDLQRGGGVPHVYSKDVAKIMMQLPPLEVQREIVAILDKFTQLEAGLEAELEARRSQYEHTRDQLLDFSGDLSSHPMRELIAELCPEGVGMEKLGSLTKTVRAPRSIPRSQYLDSGILPVIDQSQLPIAGYVNELGAALDIGACVVFGDHTREVKFVDYPFAAGADGTVILSPGTAMIPRYLYFVMAALQITSRGYNRHWSAVKNIEVPVPPLEVQREIVSILDKLDALVNDLTFGLPAEMAARRKQYEHYRNKLLTFKELETA
jgi:type I restriction enzyme S subunit